MMTAPYKQDFPIFRHQPKMIYLDSAATTQKPQEVLDAMMAYYLQYCSNIHRGMHDMGNLATQHYERARAEVAAFIGAMPEELVFTKGTTEAINLVATSFVQHHFDHVMITALEHHSNIIPWQLLGFVEGRGLHVIPMDDEGQVDMKQYENLLRQFPGSFVSMVHVSNVLGIVLPVTEMVALAHKYGCVTLVDGAQAVAHTGVDVKEIDADFYTFSAHKMYGPTGVGALYGRYTLLEGMTPYQGGGAMIDQVGFENSTFLTPPHRFEAGTQPIAEVLGFAQAVRYLLGIGFDVIRTHDDTLMAHGKALLSKMGVQLYTDVPNVMGNLSFTVKGVHHSDVGMLLDKQQVFLRTGHHCAMPLMTRLGVDGTIRLSFGIYNTTADIDRAVDALKKAIGMLQ